MRKITLFIMVLLFNTVIATAQTYPTTFWSDLADTSWYDASQDEFNIATAEALAGLSELVEDGEDFNGKTINLTANIDLDGNLWSPIGKDIDFPFSGTLNGNENTISNLYINQPQEDFIGLLGQCFGATISNIIIDSVSIESRDTAGCLVGNLSTNSSITNCHVTNASITLADYNGGGLVGGALTDSSISQSSFQGDVVGGSQIGGIAGSIWDKCSIEECYSEGTVSAQYLSGGILGYTTFAFQPDRENTVLNSYSRSDISVILGRAGGLHGGGAAFIIKNSYSTGSVSAPEFEGGFIGVIDGGGYILENNYFDYESSGLTDAVGGFQGPPAETDITGKSTAEMKDAAIIALLNAGNSEGPWSIDPAKNDGYPILEQTLSVDNFFTELQVEIYPTIATQNVFVESKMQLKSYAIYNLSGKLLSQGNLQNNTKNTLKVDQLSAGIYLLQIVGENSTSTKKIIKK